MERDGGFTLLLASPFDYERLVAEIYYDGRYVMQVIEECAPGEFEVETPDLEVDSMVVRRVPLVGLVVALEEARRRLSAPPRQEDE